ncbi:MAG: DUF502 domain-containing protein [Planctomycetales bacterium]|nr:DUF502 domain-containing protein [Planctomycetales bacterium]
MPDAFKAVVKRLAAYFLAGVFSILPLVITVAVVIWVTGFVGQFIGPGTTLGDLLEKLGRTQRRGVVDGRDTVAYVIGWAMVLGVIFIIGFFVEAGGKRLVQSVVDALLARIPLIGGIYGTSKQLVGMLDKKDEADLKGMSVVYCMFGSEHGAGLLALLVSPERYTIAGREYQIVIIPTAPVPVGGALLFVPVENLLPADLSVDALMSIYVSMGVTAPEFLQTGGTAT